MLPSEAAKIIGCGVRHVRALIANGKLSAEVVSIIQGHRTKPNSKWFYYDLDPAEVRRYAEQPQPCGFPRGQKRS